jgi:hypothetical protein
MSPDFYHSYQEWRCRFKTSVVLVWNSIPAALDHQLVHKLRIDDIPSEALVLEQFQDSKRWSRMAADNQSTVCKQVDIAEKLL